MRSHRHAPSADHARFEAHNTADVPAPVSRRRRALVLARDGLHAPVTSFRETGRVETLPRYAHGLGVTTEQGVQRLIEDARPHVRVVLDTYALISAFVLPGSAPEQVDRRVLDGRLTLVTSRPLLSQLGRILTGKFDWEPPCAEEVVPSSCASPWLSVSVRPNRSQTSTPTPPTTARCKQLAAGDAAVIVSGDRNLLTLGTWRASASSHRRSSGRVEIAPTAGCHKSGVRGGLPP
jgi:predicted nucleic acid-binding protein